MSDYEDTEVSVAEIFQSVQGEGRHTGVNSIFFRTAGCNYLCGGQMAANEYEGTEFEDQTESMAKGLGTGDESDAEWVCDTIDEWMDDEGYTVEEIYEEFEDRGLTDAIDDGAHLILTGGEPMVQQDALSDMVSYFEEQGHDPFVEVETNGSIFPDEGMRDVVDQYNISPKLTNAGMMKDVVYHPENMRRFGQLNKMEDVNADLKVVVNDKSDWEELRDDYVDQDWFEKENIYVMPAGLNQEKIGMSDQDVAELAVDNNLNYSDRLQVRIWNEVTGV